jgi:hypothetical protein
MRKKNNNKMDASYGRDASSSRNATQKQTKNTTIKIDKVLVDLLNSCRFVALLMGRNAAGSTM